MQLDRKRFFVFGLARSGRAVAQLLARHGHDVVVHDDDPAAVDAWIDTDGVSTSIRKAGRDDPSQDLDGRDVLVVSPGISLDHEIVRRARERGLEITGEIEIAYHFFSGRIVGVTGTNGKSTVVTMIGNMLEGAGLRCAVAGNIGRPFADVVERDEDTDIVVLEISSFQLDVIDEFKVEVAVLLNVTPDHLDRYHDSFEEYGRSKARILNRAAEGTVFIYNDTDTWCRRLADGFDGECVPFSSLANADNGVFIRDSKIVSRYHGTVEELIATSEFRPVGVHNLENAMAMVAVGLALGIERDVMKQTLRDYRPLPHRMEVVRILDGVTYINDSKATNVDAAIKSLVSIEGGVILILGGLDKKGDFARFQPHMDRVKSAILIGDAAEKIDGVLRGHCDTVFAPDMVGAIEIARRIAGEGDTVLLAPACASFDMFDNYEARGQSFRDAVAAL